MKIPSWIEYFLRHVYLAATKSKDTKTKIGAVLVKDGAVVSEGYNGMPRKVNDNVPERYERPEKYFWFEHAERNAIYNAARRGIATDQCVMFTQGVPCADCARAVIQSGVRKVVIHKQWGDVWTYMDPTKWIESQRRSREMFQEADIEVIDIDMPLELEAMVDGKIVSV